LHGDVDVHSRDADITWKSRYTFCFQVLVLGRKWMFNTNKAEKYSSNFKAQSRPDSCLG
jgi:hypothetical protein